jgi:hypothetical protein
MVSGAWRAMLEKAAYDNGFDVARESDESWLCFEDSGTAQRVWLTAWAGATLLVGLSHPGVLEALAEGVPVASPVPTGAAGVRSVEDLDGLDRLLRRAGQLARTVPNALLRRFRLETGSLPQTTEAEALVVQRRGQDLFRDGLLDLWRGRCAISGLAVPALLRASHAKPWKDANDEERLDVFNGLLLAAHLDAAFDGGLITVEDDGRVVVGESLDAEAREILGLGQPRVVRGVLPRHRGYLAWHRERVFGFVGGS